MTNYPTVQCLYHTKKSVGVENNTLKFIPFSSITRGKDVDAPSCSSVSSADGGQSLPSISPETHAGSRLSSRASPQTDWHVGYHAVAHQRCCFDRRCVTSVFHNRMITTGQARGQR